MDLYQEIILDHAKRPHHAGLREPFNAQVHHVNPTCGDEVTLRVQLSGEGPTAVITDLSYEALGCSISTASTSVLTDEVIGHSVEQALNTFLAVRKMLTSKGADPGDEDEIGDGVAFAGVSRYPARVKCALLGWTAFTDALTRAGVDISATTRSKDITNNSITNNSITNDGITNDGITNDGITNDATSRSNSITSSATATSNGITNNVITSNAMEES